MSFVEPGGGRARFSRSNDAFIVTLPPSRGLFVVSFLCLWLVGWAFGEIMVFRQLFLQDQAAPAPAALFMLVWLCAWTAGGTWAFYNVLWLSFGQEFISVTATALSCHKEIFGLRYWKRRYRLADVSSLRPIAAAANRLRGQYQATALEKSSVGFDYGRTTVSLFPGIDEAEAKYIIEQLRLNCPAVRAKP